MYSPSIICTANDTYCISNDHRVHVFGIGEDNEFNEYDMRIPILIEELHDIKMIDCGGGHVLCLDFIGNIFSFGTNEYGQLGLGEVYDEVKRRFFIPQKIDIPLCKQIACGEDFSMCLTEKDLLYSFGINSNGELGLKNNIDYDLPQLIPDLYNIEHIACGGHHSICKTYDNIYYGWGSNDFGQLGHIEYKNYNEPILCNNYPGDIISAKCGSSYTLLLTSEGNIYSLGNNYFGQLGLNNKNIKQINTPMLITDIPEIKRIECGDHHSMCIDVNDDLWLFGGNYTGQLGLGTIEQKYRPIKHPIISNVMDISLGGRQTFIKTFDHKIYAFGCARNLQLGIEINENKQLTPIQIFQANEDIWDSFIGKSKQKSAKK